jgi:Ca2+-binding RTX toxin-like protein
VKTRTRSHATAILATVAFASAIMVSPVKATETLCFLSSKTVTMQVAFAPHIRMFVTKSGEFNWKDTETGVVQDCGASTVDNTSTVQVSDFTSAKQTPEITLDFTRRWGPGNELEKVGKSEIEIKINDFDGGHETLALIGTSRRDHYVAGQLGFNLNGDNDGDDILIPNGPIEELYIKGRDRGDLLTVRGGFGTGGPFLTNLVTLQGDGGPDTLRGTSGDERLRGLEGDDRMFGAGGIDLIFADDGADLLKGGGGGDELDGMNGGDRLRGQKGPDDLEGGPGPDDLEGGSGNDTCSGGPGVDSISGCES